MKTAISIATTLTLLSVLTAFAEPRIWTDTRGNSVEAEFILLTGDKALLRKTDGTEAQVPLQSLCEEDRSYIIRHSPPPLEIDVDMDIDRSNTGNGWRIQVQTETVAAEVTIRKVGTSHYDAPLRAEVYLIGQREHQEDYIIMERAESEFKFPVGSRGAHTYKSGSVSTSRLEAGINAGTEYKGYLAVVYDQHGTILEIKSNKKEFEASADAILKPRGGQTDDPKFEQRAKAESNARKWYRRF